jgi:hypothetical protein
MAQLNLGIVASSETLTMEIESTLEQDIRKGKLTDDKIAEHRKLIKFGKVQDFREDEQGTVWFKEPCGSGTESVYLRLRKYEKLS